MSGRFFSALKLVMQGTPAFPPAGAQSVYMKADGYLYALDPSGNERRVNQPGSFDAEDHNLLAWSFPFEVTNSGQACTSGTIYLIGLRPNKTATTAALWWNNQAGGVTLNATQCKAALLDSTGAVLATPVNTNTLGAAGMQSVPYVANVVAGKFYWAAFLWVGTTPPSMARAVTTVSAGGLNVNLAAAVARYATNGTAQTTITNRTPASNTNLAAAIWVGLE